MSSSRSAKSKKPNKRAYQRFGGAKLSAQPQSRGVKSLKSVTTFDHDKGSRLVIGLHSVREVLQVRPKAIERAWLRQDWERSRELAEIGGSLKGQRVPIIEVSVEQLAKLGGGHQGVCLAVGSSPSLDWENLSSMDRCLLVALDGVEDPHNLGAVLRTSWLMGVSGVLVPEMRSVGLTATVAKVASGGAEHVPLLPESNLAVALERLKKLGFWVFALKASDSSRQLWDLEVPEKVVWVLGSEDRGVRVPVVRTCDEQVAIPQLSSSASYNVSVACAMALAETQRQWNSLKNIGK